MKTRIISGAVFVAIVASFFVLRELVDARIFFALLWLFSAVGSFEMARADRQITGDLIFYSSVFFGAIFVPAYVVTESFLSPGMGYIVALAVIGCAVLFNLATVFQAEKVNRSNEVLAYGTLNGLYPSIFIFFMLLANSLAGDKGFVAMLLLFVIAPFADTFAYFVGSFLKGPKLCPKLSPKKTWSGAIGGFLGGALGALVVFFIFGRSLGGNFTWYLFLGLGAVTSVLTIFGDLFESFIKRRLGIKDMGKIMPGHGGVLDRIDGMTFAIVLIYVVFALL